MNLPDLAVRRNTTFLMIFVLMGGAGLFALTQLGLDYFPEVDLGEIMILTVLPGGAPEEVESLVTKLIEDAVSGVEGVTSVESSSGNSISGIFLGISSSADIDQVEEDIRKAVDRIAEDLPPQSTEPFIAAMESSMKPLVIASASSAEMDSGELRQLVSDDIEPILSRVPGVASCDVSGGEERQINVAVNPVLLHLRGISLTQVYGALTSVQGNQPGGTIEARGIETFISVRSAFTSLEDIGEVVVGSHGGTPVRLRDVAEIVDGHREQSITSRLDGENSVLLVVRKSGDANTVNTCRLVEDQIHEIKQVYAGTMDLEVIYTQKDFVLDSTRSLAVTGVQAIILAALVLMFFLGSAVNAGIVSITMPLSFVSTFAAMYLFGVNLNIMSLAGLSIAIGMIVDNSVVVLENIHRRRLEGEARREAAVQGASQMGMAVAASTLTTVAVFIPMLFVKGLTGQIFRDLSITIAAALFISLFMAMTLIPLMASRSENLVRKHSPGSPAKRIEAFLHRLDTAYEKFLEKVLRRGFRSLIPVILFCAVSFFAFRYLPTAFLPDVREGIIECSISLPLGTSLDETDSLSRIIGDSIAARVLPGDLRHITVDAGRSEGLGALFGSDASCRINVSVYLAPEEDLHMDDTEYERRIGEYLATVPGIRYSTRSGQPIGNEYPIQINIYAEDTDTLKILGDRVRDNLAAIPGTADENHSMEDWSIQMEYHPDPGVLSLRGVSRAALAGEITIGMLGMDVADMNDGGRDVAVNLRYMERYRSSREAVAGIPVFGAPLDFWGEFTTVLAPNHIERIGRSRAVSVFASLDGRPLGDVAEDVQAMMDTLDTGGARWELVGDVEDQKESFNSMGLAILVAIVLVYMVMASQFESLLEPFILIFEIPLALTGVVWMLLLTGTTMGMTSLVGILMLIGIVVNNGIVLVDFANGIRRTEGLPADQAMVKAGRARLKPVMMTAFTTILALLPLSLGGSSSAALWAPMARTVIGGMLLATPLTLLVVPVLYTVMNRGTRRRAPRSG